MKAYFFLVLLLINLNLYSQSIRVVDSGSKSSLSYALIIFNKDNTGQYTDQDGIAILDPKISNDTEITVQMLGYQDLKTTIGNLRDTIFLIPNTYELPAIIVKNKKSTIIGFLKENSKKEILIQYSEFNPIRVAVHVNNNLKKQSIVNKILFRYNVPNSNIRYVVRPQIYAVGADKRPSNALLSKSETFIISGKNILEFDCSYEGMIFPANGVFVALEVLEVVDRNNNKIRNTNDKYPYVLTTEYKKTFATHVSSVENLIWSVEAMGYRPMWNVSLNASFGLEVITD
ncbi:MAG: carboxypeptidase-like regulatory domain-containing protein [Prevotellaceae bacterium]|jgi:hypothetical protein|nr:carboxypeptidase-like regulatory domain-containing protein [Prevotellaceae bacterium]